MDEKFIYLKIPDSYKAVYYNLLSYIADKGYDIMNDCSCLCKKGCRQIFNMWAMFQSACALYVQGETEKSQFFIDYIKQEFKHYVKIDGIAETDYPVLDKQFIFYIGCSKSNQLSNVDSLTKYIYSENTISTKPSDISSDKYFIIAFPNKSDYVLKNIIKGNIDVSNSAFEKGTTADGLYITYVSKYPGNFKSSDILTINMNSL